jgi:striatin 1/3/4
MEELYLQQHRQRVQPQLPTLPNTSVSNHQPQNMPTNADLQNFAQQAQQFHQAPQMTREPSGQAPPLQHTGQGPDFYGQSQQTQSSQSFASVPEEQVEKVTHTFDTQGRQIPNQEAGSSRSVPVAEEESESWNFEEPTSDIPQEIPPSRRPDTEAFPSANNIPSKSPPRHGKRKTSLDLHRRRSSQGETREVASQNSRSDTPNFKVRFALRGHLDVVRSVIFTGGGSPTEPEICTAGDDGMIKRWIIPASYANQHSMSNDLDISPYWSHRGHDGVVTSLAACPSSASFATGGRVSGDGWIFSGGQDATVRVWERGRVDPKATLDGHTDAVWTVCVLPATCASVFGSDCSNYGGPDRVLLASGSADGTIKIWAVSAPPQLVSPSVGSRRGVGGSRRHSVTAGSNYPSSPQPSVATTTPFHYMLVHTIEQPTHSSPTCISPLSPNGESFVVSFSDASILVFDTRTGEELIGMASAETYDGTPATGVTSVITTSQSIEGTSSQESGRGSDEEGAVHGPTGSNSGGGVEGVIISGHEDQFIRFYDANSGMFLDFFLQSERCRPITDFYTGQCTYSMLAHPSAISSLSISKDGREAVSAGHDASIRFWSLDKRICTQEITAHRIMRGEGVCSVVWSQDGRLVVSAGGDGVVKVFAR